LDKKRVTRKIVLHSTASHGPPFLIEQIDAALSLLAQAEAEHHPAETNEVEIVLHPVPERRRLIGKTRSLARRMLEGARVLRGRLPAAPEYSIYDRVYSFKGDVKVATPLGILRIRMLSPRVLCSSRSHLRATALQYWRHCLDSTGKLVPERLLAVRHRGIVIGDLAAATALRSWPQAGGSLARCAHAARRSLLDAVLLTDYAYDCVAVDTGTYVLCPEPTYLHAIYERALRARGATVLRMPYYTRTYARIGPQQELANAWVARPNGRHTLSAAQTGLVRTYLQERLDDPAKHLWYMDTYNRTDGALLDRASKPLQLDESELCTVIFLHSFQDGQYFFGVDGFADIYEWTTYTIDQLLANGSVATVCIKEHPAAVAGYYSGDKHGAIALYARYKHEPRVVWLKSDTSVNALSKLSRVVAITHHGSVAEELVFAGIPVIASTHAPWTGEYAFLRTWRTVDEYRRLLGSLTPALHPTVEPEHTAELYRFVFEYRINCEDEGRRHALNKVAAWQSKPSRVTSGQYPAAARYLGRLRAGEPEMRALLEYLVADARSTTSPASRPSGRC
jgi:hypothetical protein